MHILLVEDSPSDIRLMQEALSACSRRGTQLSIVRDGEEAMTFLQTANRPDLIFLDLNLPRKDGREVLAEIKQDDRLRRIPVIVLTTSDADADVKGCYDLHANCYIQKPNNFEEYISVVNSCNTFWSCVVRLPK